MHLALECTVSPQMCSTGFKGMFRRLGHANERKSISVTAKKGAERILEVTARRMVPCYVLKTIMYPRKIWNGDYRIKISF